MNRSENIFEDELAKVKIIIEIEEKTDGGTPTSDKVFEQAKHCMRGLGYDVNCVVGEK